MLGIVLLKIFARVSSRSIIVGEEFISCTFSFGTHLIS